MRLCICWMLRMRCVRVCGGASTEHWIHDESGARVVSPVCTSRDPGSGSFMSQIPTLVSPPARIMWSMIHFQSRTERQSSPLLQPSSSSDRLRIAPAGGRNAGWGFRQEEKEKLEKKRRSSFSLFPFRSSSGPTPPLAPGLVYHLLVTPGGRRGAL